MFSAAPLYRLLRFAHGFVFAPQNFFIGWGRLTACIAGHAIQRKNPQDESQRFSKWRLPTLPQRSAVPSAMLSLAAALASPLRCLPPLPALSPAPARRRRAHRRPPRASEALREGYGATRSWDIKDMVSLKKVSLSFSSDHWAHEVIVELVASWKV